VAGPYPGPPHFRATHSHVPPAEFLLKLKLGSDKVSRWSPRDFPFKGPACVVTEMAVLFPLVQLLRSKQFWLGILSCGFVVVVCWGTMAFRPHCRCPDLLDAFIRNETHFDRFIAAIENGGTVADERGHYPVPKELRYCGVVDTWKEEGLVYFEGRRGWHDDPTHAIVKVLKPETVYVSPLLAPHPNWVTLHVQYVLDAQTHGWYYWCYDN
jgi:hypothetical protein